MGPFGPEPGDWRPPIPAGIFLDTSIVAYLDTYSAQVWDGAPIYHWLPDQQVRQINALRVLMALANRAQLAFAVSDDVIREAGGTYVRHIAEHWQAARDV